MIPPPIATKVFNQMSTKSLSSSNSSSSSSSSSNSPLLVYSINQQIKLQQQQRISSSSSFIDKDKQHEKVIKIMLKNEDDLGLSFRDFMNVRMVNKQLFKLSESLFWMRAVHHTYFAKIVDSSLTSQVSNWKRCFMILTEIFHQKDWSICPSCQQQPLGVISSTKELACFDDTICRFKISLGFSCQREKKLSSSSSSSSTTTTINNTRYNVFRNNNNNNLNNSQFIEASNNKYIYSNNNNNRINQLNHNKSCDKCKFKCKLCKSLVNGSMVCWKTLAKDQEKEQDDQDEDFHDGHDDDDEDEVLVKCEKCIGVFRDIHTSDDTIFKMEVEDDDY